MRKRKEGVDKLTPSAVSTLVGCWIINLIVGGQLAMGNITVYFASYYYHVQDYKNINEDTFYMIGPFIVICSSLFFPLGNMVIDYFDGKSRPTIIAISAFSLGCVTITAFIKFPPSLFTIIYGLGMGGFKGCIMPSLLRAGWSHLPERKGLVSGTIISAMGIGGFIYGILIKNLCNPLDLKYEKTSDGKIFLPKEVGERVPWTLKVLVCVWLGQILIGLCLISNYEKEEVSLDETELTME